MGILEENQGSVWRQHMLKDEVFDVAHLVLDCLGQVGVVNENAEFARHFHRIFPHRRA